MVQLVFGKNSQLQFVNEAEFYRTLGFLAKSDGSTSLSWENNLASGAWGDEGRIHFYRVSANIPTVLSNLFTAGTGSILYRVNCNEFVEYISTQYGFCLGDNQNIPAILSRIPTQYHPHFQQGLALVV